MKDRGFAGVLPPLECSLDPRSSILAPLSSHYRALESSHETRRRVPLLAANDVHYHIPDRRPLQNVLTAIRHRCTVAELGGRVFPNAERRLKSAAEMLELFAACPDAASRTAEPDEYGPA